MITKSEGLNRIMENKILIDMFDVGNDPVYPTGQSGGTEYASPPVAPEPRRRRRRTQDSDPRCSLDNAGP